MDRVDAIADDDGRPDQAGPGEHVDAIASPSPAAERRQEKPRLAALW